MPAMSVTLEEKSRYTVVVEAEDRDAAVEAATEMFCQSEKPFSDFEGERDELRAFNVVDARPWEVLTETRLEREAAAEAAKAAKSESPEAQAIGDHAALLSSALDYLERYADLNDEPAGGDCRRLIASIAKVVGSAPSSLTPAEDDKKSLAEATARAYGWEHGGDGDGIWWNANENSSWKDAVSWGTTYASAAEVCEAEGLDGRAGTMFQGESDCGSRYRRLTDSQGKPVVDLSDREKEIIDELHPALFGNPFSDDTFAVTSDHDYGLLIAIEYPQALRNEDVSGLADFIAQDLPPKADIFLTCGEHTFGALEVWAFIPADRAETVHANALWLALHELKEINQGSFSPVVSAPSM